MPDKLDFKKSNKDLYAPGKVPELILVPSMTFFAVDGQGDPGGETYHSALQALYAMTFTVKMSKMGAYQPEGYMDYVLPPLEGFWWSEGGSLDMNAPRASWLWTSVIRQPEFVTEEVYEWAREECRRKKPEVNVEGLRRVEFEEGLCVQLLHVGPYATERQSVERMDAYIEANGLVSETSDVRKHHEIYLGDPRKTAPEKLKTILRHPVRRSSAAFSLSAGARCFGTTRKAIITA